MKYKLTKLKNGLKVLTLNMPDRNAAGVAIWVKAGGRYESKQNSGISHFLEHMLFKGTRLRTTKQIKQSIEGVGGMLNAFTGEEATCYFSKILKQHYSGALEVLSDMVLNATLPAKEFEKERGVILEEIKMYKDIPSHYVGEIMSGMIWPHQALGRPLAGTQKTVSGFKRLDLQTFYKKHYSPKNMLVSVAGDIEHDDVLKEVERIFGRKVSGREYSYGKARQIQKSPQCVYKHKDSEQTHFMIGFHGLSRMHPDRYKISLLHVLLGANMSSRLFEELREKRGLAYEIKSGLTSYSDTGAFTIHGGVESSRLFEAVMLTLKEIKKLKTVSVKKNELQRAKDYFMSQIYLGVEDVLDHLLWIGDRALRDRPLPDLDKMSKNIESVTSSDIKKLANRLFIAKRMNLAVVGNVDKKTQMKIKKGFTL